MSNNQNRYPENIMRVCRQRLDLESDNTSKDNIINLYTPSEAFYEVLTWEGLINYDYTIKRWIKDIYGIELD